ncbi:MAG: hypothetical protein KBD01_03840 [Acidobacteria bacterium]|nr:hypothetical protein [Acidobacteriota bacterium]
MNTTKKPYAKPSIKGLPLSGAFTIGTYVRVAPGTSFDPNRVHVKPLR